MSWPDCPECEMCLARAYKLGGVLRLACLFSGCKADYTFNDWKNKGIPCHARNLKRELPKLQKPPFPAPARIERPEPAPVKQASLFGGAK